MTEVVKFAILRERGLTLKMLRLRARKSQYEVAAQLGIHPGRLSEIESGRRQPSPDLLEKLLDILGGRADVDEV